MSTSKSPAGGVADGSYCTEIPVTTIQVVTCEHDWHEGVDENGNLVEPPFDQCYKCGEQRR